MNHPSLPSARRFAVAIAGLSLSLMFANAQTVRPEAGPFHPSQMEIQNAPAAGVVVKAGKMFNARTGTMLTNQVIVIKGERIVDVGPADRVQIPQGARVIDLSRATVLPGQIGRAHV